jgi:DNA primase
VAGGVVIDEALIQEVRDRNDIVAVVGDYVTLRKAGTHYKGLCPFHSEKTPSFTVQQGRQFYYCFGCQSGGDVISFVREINGYSFMETIKVLAERAGIDLPEPERERGPGLSGGSRGKPGGAPSKRALKDACYALGREAQAFYVDALGAMEGQACREYLRARGLERAAVQHFGLGFAPDRWEALAEHLRAEGHDLRLAERLGLVGQRKSGRGYYDKFRNRLMFPIRSLAGEVIAFSGRDLSGADDAPKYVNSPETPVYTKGDTLFGLHEARKALRTQGEAVLVEGNVDLVRLAMAGLEHVVAPLGTALTEAQCRLLRRFVPRMVLLYDGDRAGREAGLKAIPTALAESLQVRVALLPPGEDPDSLVGREGIEAITALVASARDGWAHLVETTIDETEAFADPAGPVRAIDKLAPTLQALEDARVREQYEQSLADVLRMPVSQVQGYLRRSKTRRKPEPRGPVAEAARPAPPTRPPPSRELSLLQVMLAAPEACALYAAHDVGDLLTHAAVRRAADALAQSWEQEEKVNATSFIDGLDDAGLRVHLFESLAAAPDVAEWKTAFEQLEKMLRRDALKRRGETLNRELHLALMRGDEAETERINLLKNDVLRQMEHL